MITANGGGKRRPKVAQYPLRATRKVAGPAILVFWAMAS